jgi:hypothetical protein
MIILITSARCISIEVNLVRVKNLFMQDEKRNANLNFLPQSTRSHSIIQGNEHMGWGMEESVQGETIALLQMPTALLDIFVL